MDIKIIVAAHKNYWMPKDEIYLPLHVGKNGKPSIGYQGDDTGENISAKNADYCELTGLYWAWKNMNCEYIGLCHYRRYFLFRRAFWGDKKKLIAGRTDLEKILQKTDIILPKKRNYYIETVRDHCNHAHGKGYMDKVEEIIIKNYPDYAEAFRNMETRTWSHMFNMFIMKKEKYDAYCQWLFAILFELEDVLGNQYEPRIFGYISERLLDIWLETNGYNYQEMHVGFMEKQNWFHKVWNFLKRKFI